MNHTPRIRLSASIAAAACLIAACGSGGDDAADTTTSVAPTTTEAPSTTVAPSTTDTPAESTTSAPLAAQEVEEIPDVPRQPLTGEPLDSVDDITQRPALAVKIDNHPLARPNHTGLAVADMVFEELVEGSLTRFAAVFHTSDADPVGPIRSGRSQDVALLSSFNAPLFAWSGGNPGVTALVGASFLTDLNWQKFPNSYSRGPGRVPHNLYSTTDRLWSLTPDDHPGPPPQQFAYLSEGEEFGGEPATDVEMSIGSIDIEWDWNDETQSFDRRQEGGPHVDKTYGQLSFENVVVLVVDYQPSSIDRSSPEAQTVGDGPAYVFSNGEVIKGRWFREDVIYPLYLSDENGDQIEMSVGSTFIELGQAIPSDDISNPAIDLRINP